MEDGHPGLHGVLVNPTVDSKGTEPVTFQLLCLGEQIVLETKLNCHQIYVMETAAVLVKRFHNKNCIQHFYFSQTHLILLVVLILDL